MGSLYFVSNKDFEKENVAFRPQFQMLILALNLTVHISFTPNFNRGKLLVHDLTLQSLLKVTNLLEDVTFNVYD